MAVTAYSIGPILKSSKCLRNNVFFSHLIGELKLNGALNREAVASYNLTVKAIDTGTPPNHATQIIYVTVLDVNDNPPRFQNKTYTASIREESVDPQQVI